mmetsp:Transcript_113179/g.365681  ORF Transcript_113179/g.365681 Transcript_113179/m.365681 type:complete len:291 (-) Transcript_113179:222-1094(-)
MLPIMKMGGKPRTSSASSQPSLEVAIFSWKKGSALRFLLDRQYSAFARRSVSLQPVFSHSFCPSPPASQLYSRIIRAMLLPASCSAQTSLPGERPLWSRPLGAAAKSMATLRGLPSGRFAASKTCSTTAPQPGSPEQQAPTSGEKRAKEASSPAQGRSAQTSSRGRASARACRSRCTASRASASWPAASSASRKALQAPWPATASLSALPAQSEAQSSAGSASQGGVLSPAARWSKRTRLCTDQRPTGPRPHLSCCSAAPSAGSSSSSPQARSKAPWWNSKSKTGSALPG